MKSAIGKAPTKTRLEHVETLCANILELDVEKIQVKTWSISIASNNKYSSTQLETSKCITKKWRLHMAVLSPMDL